MRSWEGWDAPGVAEMVEQTWRMSGTEMEYRTILASVVARNLSDGMSILEVGCGTGLVYGALKKATTARFKYVGVDVSEAMLGIARKSFSDGDFRIGDVFDLDFEGKSFDLVLCFEVLGHLPEIVTPLAELDRVCKGVLLFTAWKSAWATTITEQVLSTEFLKTAYPDEAILLAARSAGIKEKLDSADMNKSIKLYVVRK